MGYIPMKAPSLNNAQPIIENTHTLLPPCPHFLMPNVHVSISLFLFSYPVGAIH